MRTQLTFLAVLLCACAAHASAADCAESFQAHLESDLKLSYQEFDQTMKAGFRALAEQGCTSEAADLIEAYVQATGATQKSLTWHIAQLRATAGDYPRAILRAQQSLAVLEDFDRQPLRWNDYVLATIAFLQRDKPGLLKHRAQVEAAKELHFGNALNLKLLDALVRHFDRDYQYATTHIDD